jgi:hypothetical protein
LNFADHDARSAILVQHHGLIFEHHSAVTHVMADTEVTSMVRFRKMLCKELDDMFAAIKETSGFRFNRDGDEPSRFLFELFKLLASCRKFAPDFSI